MTKLNSVVRRNRILSITSATCFCFVALGGCLSAGPATQAGAEPAPTWRVGDWWLYEVTPPSQDRSLNLTVTAMIERSGRSTFEVVERHQDPRSSSGYFEARAMHDAETMNRVWDCVMAVECMERTQEIDFPLWENKTWIYDWGSSGYCATSVRAGDVWHIVYRERGSECRGRVERTDTYDPDVAWLTRRESFADLGEDWRLAAASRWSE